MGKKTKFGHCLVSLNTRGTFKNDYIVYYVHGIQYTKL